MVKIKTDGRTFTGRGISTDIIEASAKAYIDAINRMVGRPGKEEPGLKAEL
jgi:2-isopropylmalate synthase